MKNRKIVHISFWIIISIMLSILLYLYSPEYIIIASIPLFTTIIQIIVAEKIQGSNKYYPSSLIGYLVLNFSFFIIFILSLILIENHQTVKIGTFVVMTLVGLYSTLFFLNEKNKKLQNE